MRPTHFLLQSVIILNLMLLAACPSDPIIENPTLESSGVVVLDGVSKNYTFDQEKSSFDLIVPKKSGACSVFHAHVIEATQLGLSFNLDMQNPKDSRLSIEIAASGLENDQPELRKKYDETKIAELSENDVKSIKAGMLDEQLDASNFPILKFEIPEFKDILGESKTVTVKADIKDLQSEFTMTYTANMDSKTGIIEVTGNGVLDASKHEMPAGFGSNCIKSDFPIHLKLTLKPGVGSAETDAGTIEKYVPTIYPYEGDACHPTTGYDEIEAILLRNCAGCHKALPINGASVQLTSYKHWRTDSLRNPKQPLYLTSKTLLENQNNDRAAGENGELAMPPSSTTPITAADKQKIIEWIDAGAPPKKCNANIQEDFMHVAKAECGTPNYKEDIKSMITLNCTGCHDNSPENPLPSLYTYEAGLKEAVHPYYMPLNLWETSALRAADLSMPPQGDWGLYSPAAGHTSEQEFEIFKQWIEAGYPEDKCN